MHIRAIIDQNGKCVSTYTNSSDGLPLGPNEVELPSDAGDGMSYIGRTWDGTAWSAPIAVPRMLDHLEFIQLVQSAGGMTDAQLVAAHNDASLAALWIKFDHAPANIEKTHPLISPGLDVLAGLGYVPNGKDAVLSAWPAQ